MELSIVFATFKNEDVLDKSLNAYCNIITDYTWELIIVDNACRKETRTVIKKFQQHLPIVLLEQFKQGKNNALNKTLPIIKGELVMFTDNDIIPESNIIDVYVEAAKVYPDANVFGGRILPDIKLPSWIDTSSGRIRSAFGIFDKGDSDISLPPMEIWGGNMMLRTFLFKDHMSFNIKVGPSGSNYVMGSETELLKRLEANGHQGMYIANSIVHHQIRSEQLTINWLKHRTYRLGRGVANGEQDNSAQLFGIPRYLIKSIAFDSFHALKSIVLFKSKKEKNKSFMDLYFNLGRFAQFRNISKR
jgi:glycosyltransferase involved in cell wall biosynthesis